MYYIKAFWNRLIRINLLPGFILGNTQTPNPPSEDAAVPPNHLEAHTTHKGGWRAHGGARR